MLNLQEKITFDKLKLGMINMRLNLENFIVKYKEVRNFDKGSASGIPREGLVAYYFNRRISPLFTVLLLDKNVTPNQISVFIFLLGVLTCVPLYLSGNFFAAGIMVWIISILDGVDGELARAKGMITRTGAFIDSLLDRLFDIAIIFSIALAVSLKTESSIPWIFASVAFLGMFLDHYTVELYGNRIDKKLIGKVRILIAEKTRFWPHRDIFLFIISIASIIKFPHIGLLIAGSLSGVFSLVRILIVLNRYKH